LQELEHLQAPGFGEAVWLIVHFRGWNCTIRVNGGRNLIL
jgi:hypothetical protein